MNKLKNLNTGQTIKRLYHDEEVPKVIKKLLKEKPKLKEEETVAKRREKRIIKKPVRLDL